MDTETRYTGIDVIGDIAAWGTHFCLFYETKEGNNLVGSP